MALRQELAAATKSVEALVAAPKKPQMKKLFGAAGGIAVVLAALREFCKAWPKVKPELRKVVAWLRKEGQKQMADVLDGLIKFLNAISKVCKFIPS